MQSKWWDIKYTYIIINITFMMKKDLYVAPEVEVLVLAVEQGFMLSTLNDSMDYGDGGEGSLMD